MTFSTNQHLTRQLDLIPMKCLDEKINIIGGGAIGSFTALSLAKMGFQDITVWDNDSIDVENMNCQFFRFRDIGKQKVEALQELIFEFTNVKIEAKNELWMGQKLDGILICCVDNMSTRKNIWESHQRKAPKTKLIIDSRMGAETGLLYGYNPIKPEECDNYAGSLYSDEEAVQERCTAKSTVFAALSLAGLICAQVKNFVVNNEYFKATSIDLINMEMN